MRIAPLSIGDREILVEVVTPTGSQPTSRLQDAAGRVVDAFGEVEQAVRAICGRLISIADELPEPADVEVQFGLKFTAEGNVVLAGASAEASLSITVKYRRKPDA